MADLVTIPADELEALRARIVRLSREKAHLALVNETISRLESVSGLENVVGRILATLMDTIGGSNLLLYYRIDADLHVADVFGRRETIPDFDDPLAREVFETGGFRDAGESAPPPGARMEGGRPGSAWLFPLEAGGERIGVVRMEGIFIDGAAMRGQLQSVFHYAAMALRGEIQSYSRLKAAYDALRRSEERFRSVVGTAHDGILLIDEAGRIVFWNAAAAEIFGYAASEALGQPLALVIPGETGERHRWRMRRLEREPAGLLPGRLEPVDGVRKDGSPIPLELSLATWSTGGESFCTVVVRDIRLRREAEAALRASEEQLRQAMKMEAVGRLAGGIAHDFNNLLTVINGYGEMALRQVEPGSTLHREIAEIRQAGLRAASLTQQLLAFSRRQVVQAGPLDLNAVVGGMADMLRRLIGEDILLSVALSAVPLVVTADAGQLEQVVVNLVVNARDAMPDGGTLTLRTAPSGPGGCPTALASPGACAPCVVLSVADTGCGMNEETKARLFEPFFTTKPVGKGTGLGLSTVYGIVSQAGGHIEVDSEPGRGTEFRVCLPAAPGAAPGAPAACGGPAPAGHETVLLVEDEPAVRALVREILEELGYAVVAASDGAEALRLFEERPGRFDVLVSDVVMPRMNGRELAERVRKLSPGIRLLLVSGYTDHESVRPGAFPAGAGFLQKPFTPDDLARKMQEVISGSAGDR